MKPETTPWLDDFFAAYYRRRPVNATFIGVHDHDDRLPDYSENGVADTFAEMQTLLAGLRSVLLESATPVETLDCELAAGFLEIQLWEYASAHFHRGNPSLYTGEAIFGVMALFLRDFAPLEQRLEAAIARMRAVPTLLAQGEANVRSAPAAWTERAIRECDGAIAFFERGADLLIAEYGIDDPRFRPAADVAATAFARYTVYLESELRQHPNDGYACGPEAFDLLLRRGHFLDKDARSIEAQAAEALAEAEAYLREHARDLGAASPAEALAQLEDGHPPADGYYRRYDEIWAAAQEAAIEYDLLTWPDYPIRYVPQPHWAREAAPYLYFLPYRAPPAFDHVVPVDYLVTPIEPSMPAADVERLLRANNDSVIKLNHVVHHGGIGHHVQNWHAYRSRSRIGQIAAVDCAARIAMFCGGTMAEGWACYATDLMDEIGFLTPLERYAERHTRLRMAARALVDVRLHHGDISLEGAAAFYQSRVGMTHAAAHAESVKNSMFPGAAVMYLVGTDLIHELRRDLATGLGPQFSLRRFHDEFLSFGSAPVARVARAMRAGQSLG